MLTEKLFIQKMKGWYFKMADWKNLTQAVGDLEEDDVMEILNDFVATNPTEAEAEEAVAAALTGCALPVNFFFITSHREPVMHTEE